ncbi:MAG: penicillin-binding protein [Bacteroidales bacterium]|nr:penicillin-binding protein [Bacteroidales bacterium]
MNEKRKGNKKGNPGFRMQRRIIFLLAFVAVFALIPVVFVLSVYMGFFGSLPGKAELTAIQHQQASIITDDQGVVIGKIYKLNRINIHIDEIPLHVKHALIATEDSRFYMHEGIDYRSYLRVLYKTVLLGDENSGGGSTISQQLAKNLFGRRGNTGLDLVISKVKEVIIATRLEDIYRKEKILELYLNTIPFGEDLYGLEAASTRFFNKHASDLTIEEGALLVGMLKANTYYNPRIHPENALKRRNVVIKQMKQNKYIDEAAADSLQQIPLRLEYANLNSEGPADYFLYQVRKRLKHIIDSLNRKRQNKLNPYTSGYVIQTTLNAKLQRAARKVLHKHLKFQQHKLDQYLEYSGRKHEYYRERKDLYAKDSVKLREVFTWQGVRIDSMLKLDSLWHYDRMLQGGMLMIDNQSGAIKTWIGSNHFRYLPYDLVKAKRPMASAFKPLVAMAALSEGMEPCTYFNNDTSDFEAFEGWKPRNYDRSSGGECAMWYTLARSKNIPAVDMYMQTGYEAVKKMIGKLGLSAQLPKGPAAGLGTINASLLEGVVAYSVFANSGRKLSPYFIEKITKSNGDIIYKHNGDKFPRVVDSVISEQVTAILQKVVEQGTAASLRNVFNVHYDLAAKTGTNQEYTDAWFYFFNRRFTAGVYASPRNYKLHFNNALGAGASMCLPVAAKFLRTMDTLGMNERYLHSFGVNNKYNERMTCEPCREKGLIKRLWHDLFTPRKKAKQEEKPEQKKDTKNISKIKEFFKKIFKGKDDDTK